MATKIIKSACIRAAAIAMAAVAASATLTVHAASPLYWTGGEKATSTEESPYNIWNAANWGGTTPGSSYNLDISAEGTTYLNSEDGTTKIGSDIYLNSGDYVFTGPLKFVNLRVCTNENSAASILKKDDDWTVEGNLYLTPTNGTTATFVNESGNVTVNNIDFGTANRTGGTGTLTIKGGTVTVGNDTRFYRGYGTINLDGGTLVTKKIQRYGGMGGNGQHINFNGGTLKASAAGDFIIAGDGYLNITVNAGGGTIDCNGNAITFKMGPSGRSNNFPGVGGLTFTGSNTITLDCEVSYSGATSVTPGTTLFVKRETAKNNILSHGLVVAGVPTAGQTIFTYASALDASDLTNVSCPLAPATTFRFSDEGKTNIVVDVVGSHPDNVWTGAAGDNNLSTVGNWYNGVPTGNALIYSAGPARLMKGGSFAPTSITFFDGSASVTIDGDFTTLTAITNNSSVNQTFAGFVDFGEGDIDVTQTGIYADGNFRPGDVSGGCVVFAGGVKGNYIVNHTILSGHYELTTNNFEAATGGNDRIVINVNSSLSVKNAGNTSELYIRDGATFNVENFTRSPVGSYGSNRLWYWNKGTCIVSNCPVAGDNGRFWLGGSAINGGSGDANTNAVLKIGTLTSNGTGSLALHCWGNNATTHRMYIGSGGVNIASNKTGYYMVEQSAHKTTLRPWNSDFTFGRGLNAEYDFLLGSEAGKGNINFTLNTDDEAGVPRTITMDARIKTTEDTSSITVAGHGTNIVTSSSPLMTGTYAVTDAATVKFTAGAGFANGTISLGDGTTLEYTNVGSALALPCSSLVLPSSGKATLRINGDRLRDGEHVLVSGISAGAASLLDVEPAASVLDGRRYEVMEKNGNLVLSVVSSGMMIIFK